VSLAVAAIKIAAVRSLKGRTSAGDAVFDSVVEPFDALRDHGAPVVVVYCDTGKRHVEGPDLFGTGQVIELSLDMFVAQAVTVDAGETEIRIPASDEGHEVYLRSLAYEIEKVLLADRSPWPDLFRRLWFRASAHEFCEWDRGAIAEKGRRQALLRVTYKLGTIADPIPGAEPEGVWADLVAAMEADHELADLARYWHELIAGTGAPDWQRVQAALGLSAGSLRALGLGPQVAGDASAPGSTSLSTPLADRTVIVTPSGDHVVFSEQGQ
jgi:hypothetical protein